ncbi:MAG: glucosamine-6-phosphate isomerase [Lentisphaeria bacterium]|nr:glucosamine-6-phosphate isomerase [Lentisphaeria bacterium]MDY0176609.1 glucosamine-6-phosphate isomerase [Lentisphaeria bacterium]
MRKESVVAPGWWDYTTISKDLVADAAKLTIKDLEQLSRPGFKVVIYDTLEDFYLAEALEYIDAWRQSSPDNPCGICGPIGPTEQLPLVARLVNSLGLNLGKLGAQFWGMDEWVENGVAVTTDHPLSFSKCVKQMCFDLMCPELRMPEENMHFPAGDNLAAYSKTFDQFKCKVMQGGQGDVKHWAFNDPVKREGKYADNPPSPEEYLKFGTRIVDLHPMTIMQNARTSGGGNISQVPSCAATVGPVETWKAEKVSIWQAGAHDNPFGQRLTALMIAKNVPDSAVPMSLLAKHPNVQFNYYRHGVGVCEVEMH